MKTYYNRSKLFPVKYAGCFAAAIEPNPGLPGQAGLIMRVDP